MSADAPTSSISQSSTVTIALLSVFLGLAFALGVGYQRLNSVESQTARTTVLVEQQAEIIRQNARRLDLLDQSLADFEIDRLRRP